MNESKKKEELPSHCWWIVWGFSFLASLITPVVFHWCKIDKIVEPLRYPWGLLPAELLFLRNLGELSFYIPAILILLLIRAIYKTSARRALICSGALLTAIFSSLYGAYCLTVVSMYLVGYTHELQRAKSNEGTPTSSPHGSLMTPNHS